MSVARDLRIARFLKKKGFVYPYRTVRAARRAGITMQTACALLTMETGNGRNVYGHDPVPTGGTYTRGGAVTRRNYTAYKRWRGPSCAAGRCQGVGPTQLTWFSYQDQADRLGGCWHPFYNMVTGFGVFKHLVRDEGGSLWRGAKRYNGSGSYADSFVNWRTTWAWRFKDAGF